MGTDSDLVLEILDNAILERSLGNTGPLDALENDPASVFQSAGIVTAPAKEFNTFFAKEAGPILAQMSLKGFLKPAITLAGAKCLACKTAVWGIAAGIVAAGITMLSTTSAPVIALAKYATLVLPYAVNVNQALLFLQSLTGLIGGKIADIATKICDWLGACP